MLKIARWHIPKHFLISRCVAKHLASSLSSLDLEQTDQLPSMMAKDIDLSAASNIPPRFQLRRIYNAATGR